MPANKLEAEMSDIILLNIYNNFFRIVERITPRLSHYNSCVVLAGIKVLVKLLEHENDA